MTRVVAATLSVALLLTVGVGPARAGIIPGGTLDPLDPFVLNFDENGNGSVSVNGGPFVPSPGFIGVDPSTGLTTLIYQLPNQVGPGEVLVRDADGTFGDAINFFNAGGNGFMAFYSDVSALDPKDSLADVGVPILTNFFVDEVGPEGDNHFDYVIPNDNAYHGISDSLAVPEPATLALFGMATLVAAGYRRWKRGK
jgi:hypothetical protein